MRILFGVLVIVLVGAAARLPTHSEEPRVALESGAFHATDPMYVSVSGTWRAVVGGPPNTPLNTVTIQCSRSSDACHVIDAKVSCGPGHSGQCIIAMTHILDDPPGEPMVGTPTIHTQNVANWTDKGLELERQTGLCEVSQIRISFADESVIRISDDKPGANAKLCNSTVGKEVWQLEIHPRR